MAAMNPGPGMLQVVLVASDAIHGIHSVAEIVGDRKTEGVALGHDRHIDAQSLVAGKVLTDLYVQGSAEAERGIGQQCRSHGVGVGQVVTLTAAAFVRSVGKSVLRVDDAGVIETIE